MSVEALDAMNGKLDADLRVFTGDTMSRLGALEDNNPDAFAGLKDLADQLRGSLIQWRRGYRATATAGFPVVATAALVRSGGQLHDALKQINGAVRSATPYAVTQWMRIAAGTVSGVAGDISTGIQAIGKATIEAGKQTLILEKWLPWIAVALVGAYFIAPALLNAGLKGFNESRERRAS